MELIVSYPLGSGIKPKLLNLSKVPQTVNELITEIVAGNQKLGPIEQYVIYVPARPAQKAKSSWNDHDTPFSSLNLQPRDAVHLKKRIALGRVICVTKAGNTTQIHALDVSKPVSWNIQQLGKKFNLQPSTLSNFVFTLNGSSTALNPEGILMKQDIPGDNLSFILRQKDVTYEPQTVEAPVAAPVVDINGPASAIRDPQLAGWVQLLSKKKKFEKYWFILKDKWLLWYARQDSPKPEGCIPLQTFLFQYGDKDKTSKDKNKQNTIELRVDEGAKGLNLYILKIDDGSFTKWGQAFENLLASGTLGGGAPPPPKKTQRKGAYFGVPLADCVTNPDGSEIPELLEQGFRFIELRDLKTEGIFRLSGSANVINEYKRKFDAGEPVDFMKETDPHAVTGIIKLYLRELPEPLLTFDLHPYFMGMDGCKEKTMRLRFTKFLISRLPPLNRATLKRLMGFLSKVAQHSDVNKMALHNLATVFGPNLLGTRDKNIMQMVENTAQVNNVTNYLIQEYNAIFEKEETPEPAAPVLARANYDYPGESETDLPFHVGDIIFVASQMKDGWWWGELNGKFGRLPGSYVVLLSPEETSSHMQTYNASVKAGKNEKALNEETAAVDELRKQRDELLSSLEALAEKRRKIEENAHDALSALRTALTSSGNNLPTKLVDLRSKVDEFKTQQESFQAAKSSLSHDLETFSQDLSCTVSATPATAKKGMLIKKTDSKPSIDEANVNALRAAIGAIWNRFIAEDVIRKKLIENQDDLVSSVADLHSVLKSLQ